MKKIALILLILLVSVFAVFAGPQAEQTTGDQPVTLTVFFGRIAPKNYTPGVQDDPVAREITKRTGVIMDITPGNAVAEVDTYMTTLFASDTLPDITPQGSGQLWPQMITAKKILAMDPYLEKYGRPGVAVASL